MTTQVGLRGGEERAGGSPPGGTLLTVKEVAERLRVSGTTVIRLVATGELPAMRVGRLYRVRLEELEAWQAEQTRRVQESAESVAQMFPPRRKR